jgi:hypothetical protein
LLRKPRTGYFAHRSGPSFALCGFENGRVNGNVVDVVMLPL